MSKILDGLNENQKLAVQHEDGACCVVASAGSGKSTVLVSRVQYLIESGVNPNGILTFTFTKKAGEELKEKLQNQLGDKAKGGYSRHIPLSILCNIKRLSSTQRWLWVS